MTDCALFLLSFFLPLLLHETNICLQFACEPLSFSFSFTMALRVISGRFERDKRAEHMGGLRY